MAASKVIVLGVQRGHDAGVCLMRDGIIMCVVEAERVFGIKHADGPGTIPEAFRIAIQDAGIRPQQIDRIIIADGFRDKIEHNHPHLIAEMHGPSLVGSLGTIREMSHIGGELGLAEVRPDVEVYGVCHHAAHAAAAIYMSGFEECLAYVYDGYGTCCGSIGYAYKDGVLNRIEDTRDRILIGWRYQLIAHFIKEIDKDKTKVYDLAGKVMGLNAFGETDRAAVEALKIWLRKDFADYQRSWDSTTWWWFPGLVNEVGFARDRNSARDADLLRLLASLQVAIDEVVCEEIEVELARLRMDRVVVTGGCAYNILTNAAIERNPSVSEFFVPPNAGDAGLAMGASIIGSTNSATGLHFPKIPLRDKRSPYKGPRLLGVRRSRVTESQLQSSVLDQIVERLCSGGIVGFISGRLEIGPRALGCRSLLADATHPQMREIINQRIKRREWWRPFAPVARSVDAREYFEFGAEDHYMLRSATVREEWRPRLIAVTHADNSARLQVIPDEAAHPSLWQILTRLRDRNGVGVCLNTSLNLGARPIINSMDEVYELLGNQDIDFMYVDGAIISRS